MHFRPQPHPAIYSSCPETQLYSMDLAEMLRKHLESGSEAHDRLHGSGSRRTRAPSAYMAIDKDFPHRRLPRRSPARPGILSSYKIPIELQGRARRGQGLSRSMGIYIFEPRPLMEEGPLRLGDDFGKENHTHDLAAERVNAYVFDGTGKTSGTIKSFYEANLNLHVPSTPTSISTKEDQPIHTHKRNLPASKLNYCSINLALTAEGCIIQTLRLRDP